MFNLEEMGKIDLGDNVFYIGVDDLKTSLFESHYIIPDGVSYNSYVICDDKIALLDTVDKIMSEEWKKNLNCALNNRKPDYLIVHHMEPDHSALIKWVLDEWPSVKLVATSKAIQMLPNFFEDLCLDDRVIMVKDGDQLDLGHHKLAFYTAPMVHWPEVMMTYDATDNVLYSADAFGKFGALERCGFRGSDDADWACEARRYYFNIVGKYGNQVKSVMAKLSGLSIKSIRPLHGPLLEDNLSEYLKLYDTWCQYKPETEGVYIAVASVYGGTMQAAIKLSDLLKTNGVQKVVISDLCRSDMAENVEHAFQYSHIVLAAASYDGGVFTPMYDFIHRLKEKGFTKRRIALIENGSWAPCAARAMCEQLSTFKNLEILEPVVTIKSRLKSTDMPQLEALAKAMLT